MNATLPAPQRNTDARAQRYANVSLSDIRAYRATTPEDFETVARLRQAGFGRLDPGKAETVQWVDESDHKPGVFSLIGCNAQGVPLATLRVQDGRHVPLELEHFVSLSGHLGPEEFPASQFARLSVIKGERSTDAMFGVFKAAWHWCYREGLRTIVIATPPWSRQIYDFMLFKALGLDAEFNHALAGGAHHVAMKLPVQTAETVWKSGGMPLSPQYFDIDHPQLTI